MHFTQKVWIVPLFALIALVLGGFATFSNPGNALAWNLSAQCSSSTHVVGQIDIPSDATGTPYNVFVEQNLGNHNWQWVQGAGVDVQGTGTQTFHMDVSQTRSDAIELRVRYKDRDGNYGQETSNQFAPCRPAPLNLHVFDLQAECTNAALHIVGGMIGVSQDANGFPWTVFLEYQAPGNNLSYAEDWHWVSGTGVKIGNAGDPDPRGQMLNFQFNDSTTPTGVTELRVRYKSGPDNGPWTYGSQISLIFSPCKSPTPVSTNPPAPVNPTPKPPTPVQPNPPSTPGSPSQPVFGPPPPPVTQNVDQSVDVTSGGSSSSCCSSGCCGGDVLEQNQEQDQQQDQEQTQTQTQEDGDVNVTVDGNSGGSGDGDDDFEWWWLIPIVALLAILAIVALVALGVTRRNDDEDDNDDDSDHEVNVTTPPPASSQ